MSLNLILKLLIISIIRVIFLVVLMGHFLKLRTVVDFNVQLFYVITVVFSSCGVKVLISTCVGRNTLNVFLITFTLSSFWTYSWLYSSCPRHWPLLTSTTLLTCIILQRNMLLRRPRRKVSSIYLTILLNPILLMFPLSFQFLLHFLSYFVVHCQFSVFAGASVVA